MITITLGRKKTPSFLDDVDADLSAIKWFSIGGYAARINPDARPVRIMIHRIVMARIIGRELTNSEIVDHINRNSLDNRRGNLRLATRKTNGQNRAQNRNSRSTYKGVCWFKAGRNWRATISVDGKQYTVGYFDNIRDAVIAYNLAAKEYFGEFAYINPVPEAIPPVDAEETAPDLSRM
jgi:hypothetical protein